MDSDKIDVSESIRELLRAMIPAARQRVSGVISRLADDQWREANKIDFGMDRDDQLWGIVEDRVNLVFIEEKNGRLSVVHVATRSRFRPDY